MQQATCNQNSRLGSFADSCLACPCWLFLVACCFSDVDAQVALARVGQHRYHPFAFTQALRNDQRSEDVGSGRDADQHAFLAADLPRRLDRVLVLDRDKLVVNLTVEYARDKARAEPNIGGPPRESSGQSAS